MEGIEEMAQLRWLATQGEVTAQGFLLAEPMEVPALLEALPGLESNFGDLLDEIAGDDQGKLIDIRSRTG